jgi:hypothetical protein
MTPANSPQQRIGNDKIKWNLCQDYSAKFGAGENIPSPNSTEVELEKIL